MQLAKLVGAVPVIAFDINPAVRDRALELGADYAFDSRDPDIRDKVAAVTGNRMFDVTFDAVGRKATFEQAFDLLTVGGRLVVVGMSDDCPSSGSTTTLALTKKQVLGHLGSKNADIATLAALVSHGRLDLSRSISDIVPLADFQKGIKKLETQEGNPIRILVKP